MNLSEQASFRLRKARQTLILDHVYWGVPATKLTPVESTRTKTMATDGRCLYYNVQFVAKCTDAELVGTYAHEVMHPAMQHHTRRGNRDPREWNIAGDLSINPILFDAGFKLPAGALFEARFEGMSAELIYDVRARERKQREEQERQRQRQQQEQDDSDEDEESQSGDDGSQDEPDEDEGDDGAEDDATRDEDAQDESDDEGESEDEGEGERDEGDEGDAASDEPSEPATEDAEDDGDAPQSAYSDEEDEVDADPEGHRGDEGDESESATDDAGDESEGEDETPVPGEVWDAPEPVADAAEWKVTMQQAAMAATKAGTLPGGVANLVARVNKPRTDWRAILRRFVQQCAVNDYSWRQPNRRYAASGIYLPALRSEDMGPLVVMLDTSGSTFGWQPQFLGEVQSVADEVQPEAIYLIECDARVHRVTKFERGELIVTPDGTLRGQGGTDFRPPFEYIAREGIEPVCILYLTDGDGRYPDQPCEVPTLWCMTPAIWGEPRVAPWGETVQLEPSEEAAAA